MDSLQSSECYLNYGGSVSETTEEKPCYEGETYEYKYNGDQDGTSYVYIVVVATADKAAIKISYWADV